MDEVCNFAAWRMYVGRPRERELEILEQSLDGREEEAGRLVEVLTKKVYRSTL